MKFIDEHLIWGYFYGHIIYFILLFTSDIVVDKFLHDYHDIAITIFSLIFEISNLTIGIIFAYIVMFYIKEIDLVHNEAIFITRRTHFLFPIWVILKIIYFLFYVLISFQFININIQFPFSPYSLYINWSTFIWVLLFIFIPDLLVVICFRLVKMKEKLLMTPIAYQSPKLTSPRFSYDGNYEDDIEDKENEEIEPTTQTEDISELTQIEVTVLGSIRKENPIEVKEKVKKSIQFAPEVEIVDVKKQLFNDE